MSGVERLHVEPVSRQAIDERPHYGVPPSAPAAVPPPLPPQPAGQPQFTPAQLQQIQRQAVLNSRVVALLNAVAMIVSARLLLLLATCFGFVLALEAEASQTRESIAVLIVWSVLTVLPLVVLDVLARQPKQA